MTLEEARECVDVGGIYVFRNKVNGKCYVGQSINIRKRFSQHMNKYRSGKEYPLYRALRKYGLENFEFEILETFPDLSREDLSVILNEREIYWIEQCNSFKDGYNQTLGGEATLGWIPSDLTRKRLSEALTGHPGNPEQMKPCRFINIQTSEWIEFESIQQAADHFKIARSSIVQRMNLIYKSPIYNLYLSEEQYNYYTAEGLDLTDLKPNSRKREFKYTYEYKYTKEEFLEAIEHAQQTTTITSNNIPELFGICKATFGNYLRAWHIKSPLDTHRKYKYLIVEDTFVNTFCKLSLTEFAEQFGLKDAKAVRCNAQRHEDGSLYKRRYKIYSEFEQPYGFIYPDQDGNLHHFVNARTKCTITSTRGSLLSLFEIMDDISEWRKID